jgi:L-alanine-DL-glutamate epimerase-like enolase superfamily enzyme
MDAMKITGVRIHHPAGLLRLCTDGELEGWCVGLTPDICRNLVEHMAPVIIDQSPFDRERLWQELARKDRQRHTALRGFIDIALWDLVAKAAAMPVFRYINGFRNHCPVYKRGAETSPGQILEEAQRARNGGYKGYKVATPLPIKTMVPLIHHLRETVGDDFYLMLDGGGQLTIADAIKMGRALDETGYYWFDRPRQAIDTTGGKQVADELDTPITAEVTTPLEASQVMSMQSADHIKTGTPYSGGITDILKIARCAEAFGAFCHLNGPGACDGFAHGHLLGAIKNSPFFEWTDHDNPSPIIKNSLQVVEGHIRIPSEPGLGMDIDPDALDDQTAEIIST